MKYIQNKKESDLTLGVSAQGIGIYKDANRITPRPFFSWSEIKNISFKNKTVKYNIFSIYFHRKFWRSLRDRICSILEALRISRFYSFTAHLSE